MYIVHAKLSDELVRGICSRMFHTIVALKIFAKFKRKTLVSESLF